MISILLDGMRKEVPDGTRLRDILTDHDQNLVVAIIRPGKTDAAVSRSYLMRTSAGEVVIEANTKNTDLFLSDDLLCSLHWRDQRSIHFGPFPSHIKPIRKEARYERGDVLIGCGGYDPFRSYLAIASRSHIADHGAEEGGGTIGQVVSGLGVLDRLKEGDRIESVEPIVTFSDNTESYTTTDPDLLLLTGMHIISHMRIEAQGFDEGRYSTEAARSVEHLLLGCKEGEFWTALSSSTHIRDEVLAGTDVPEEVISPRHEGTVTIRTTGKKKGSIYLYTEDLPRSLHHTVVGQIVHGSELARIVHADEKFRVRVIPERFDLAGYSLVHAKETAKKRGIPFSSDNDDENRVVVRQIPKTTMEVLSTGSVSVETISLEKVIDITLDDVHAYKSCRTFREITGLKFHNIGELPHIFSFEDVHLFKGIIPSLTTINPENTPKEGTEISAGTLAMTNDSRKSVGMVGVRTESNDEFGPTSEPFTGTNIIGTVIHTEKLKKIQEGETIYFREAGI